MVSFNPVQKKMFITDEAATMLKRDKLIAGRKPNFYVEASIASATDDKAAYIKNRAFDDEHYKKMIEAFIKKFSSASRKELDDLVMEKLSSVLSQKQKKIKLNNLISSLRKDGRIENAGSDTRSKWVLTKN